MKPSDLFVRLFEILDLPKGTPEAMIGELAAEFQRNGWQLDAKNIADSEAEQILAEARADPEKLRRWFTQRVPKDPTLKELRDIQEGTERVAAQAFMNLNGPTPARARLDKTILYRIAQGNYAHSYALSSDDDIAAEELGRWAASLPDPSLHYQFLTRDGRSFPTKQPRGAPNATTRM